MDILVMNNLWIEDSHYEANRCRKRISHDIDTLDKFEYLDMMGLFETCWMIHDFDDYTEHDKNHYGYPSNE